MTDNNISTSATIPHIITNTPRPGETPEQTAARATPQGLAQGSEAQGNVKPLRDPAPDPVEAARQATENFVRAIARKTKLALGERRTELDNLMEEISFQENSLVHSINALAQNCHKAGLCSNDIKAIISKAEFPFLQNRKV